MVTCRLTLKLLYSVMPTSKSFTQLCYIDILAVWVSWKRIDIDDIKCASIKVTDVEGKLIEVK